MTDSSPSPSDNFYGIIFVMLISILVWFNLSAAFGSQIISGWNSHIEYDITLISVTKTMKAPTLSLAPPQRKPKPRPFQYVAITGPNRTFYQQQQKQSPTSGSTSGPANSTNSNTTTSSTSSCNSPEFHIPWPLQGSTPSSNPQHMCGLQPNINPFMDFLLSWNKLYQSDSCETIIYGAAFGRTHVKDIQSQHDLFRRKRFRHQYGPCFHILVLEQHVADLQHWPDKRIRVVGIPEWILPYQNHRRNVKLFKFLPQLLFPQATTIIWQDLKFFRSREQLHSQPTNYSALYRHHNKDTCLTVTSLPLHPWTSGEHWRNTTHPQLRHHCDTIVASLQRRPSVTDAPESIVQQCQYYLDTLGDSVLDPGMIDTAFIAWHFRQPQCVERMARLQCEILNQLHCYSDRDQIAFPYAIGQMQWTPSGPPKSHLNPRKHAYPFVDTRESAHRIPSPIVHVVQSACHWYFHRIGDCPEVMSNLSPSLAIMVVGTQQRYQMESTFTHVFDPNSLRNEQQADYFISLSKAKSTLFRQDAGYASRMVHDPFLGPKEATVGDQIYAKLLEYGIRNQVHMTAQGGPFRNDPRIVARFLAKHQNQDDWLRTFPSLDLRKSMGNMTAVGNANMLALFYTLEQLWEDILDEEIRRGSEYDYILILRDDTLWLRDFSLQRILDYGKKNMHGLLPDAYVLSCNAREPAMLSSEICDHAILVKRAKATVFTKYLTSLLEANLDQCHARAQKDHGFKAKVRGCNSEMILKYIAEVNNVTIQQLPQSLMPFQRAATIQHANDTIEHCLHKFCQSKELPLDFPKPLRRCKDIV